MFKAITLRCFPADMPWRKCFREAGRAGYEGVEINFDGRFDLNCPARTLREIKQTARRYRIKIASVYSRQQWTTSLSSRHPAKKRCSRSAIKRLVDIAEYFEAPTVLTIPGTVDNSILSADVEIVPYDEVFVEMRESLVELAGYAQPKGVSLAIENVPNKFLLSPLEMRDFIDYIASPALGCHFDVANCLYSGGYPEQWIRILGQRIKAVHLKDYRLAAGTLAGFVDIFAGDINWPEVCRALAEIDYNGALISEVLPAYKYHPEILWESAGMAIDRLRQDILRYKRA
ncbi:MAG: sugar phosphate isomerase/epimerase [Kiritimatiellae bacterium]|nr:sugar phosphate isomerase/epimerase [Kiritimatiellia bacterium]